MDPGALTSLQTVFCLFYAIAWGMIANAQIKWRAFNWPVAINGCKALADDECKPAWHRLQIAVVFLMLLPMVTFVLLLWLLDGVRPNSFSCYSAFTCYSFLQLLLVVVAAQAPFGFTRIWTSILEARSERYYLPLGQPELGEPGLYEMHLYRKWSRTNLKVGVGYVGVAIAAAWITGALGR